ncbi:MAG: HEAT repeat domain-containing protein, partial [Actinobacteria bacterium]|nr:HEAT repeat domain-containing protein [Actinomycetota bacterium]
DGLFHLAQQLRDSKGSRRARAREELTTYGEEAVSVLLPLLTDQEKQTRWEAVKTLAAIGSPEAAPAVIPLLEDKDAGVRWLAARALVAAGHTSVPLLLRRLIEPPDSTYLRQGALHVFRTLSRSSDHYRDHLQPLITALETLHAADLTPETARDALHAWSDPPVTTQAHTDEDVQYLFDSKGDYIAFRQGVMVFNIDADWIGWLPWDEPDVVTSEGQYLGSITADDRFFKFSDRDARPYAGFPGYPPQPILPPFPSPRGYTELPAAAKDVRLPRA